MIPTCCKTLTILFFPFIHLVSCLDTCYLRSNSPHCQHPVLSSTSIPETTPVIHARGLFLAFTLCSCHSLVQTHWLKHNSSSGVDTIFSPVPLLLQQKHSTLLLSVLPLTKEHPRFKYLFSKCCP